MLLAGVAVRLCEPDKAPLRELPSRRYAAYPLPYTALNKNCSPHHAALAPLLSFLPVFVAGTFPQKNLLAWVYVRSAIPFQFPTAAHKQPHLPLLPYHVIRQTAPDFCIAVDTPSICNQSTCDHISQSGTTMVLLLFGVFGSVITSLPSSL